ncbi:GNAT family N-acetyltransferase [Pseudonocardia spinosispora]|uniref:GNAT family N-acetyltransferase n=1 Tax=Pseudonocardia spinosispora TaxID=103441 RepID=UPI00040AB155|nr:GNAT family N-acetyltransferase [Pseudonocardia spinosispora]
MTARIEPLRVRDAAAVGRLLADSHHDYPAYQALWPKPGVRARVLRGYLTAIARDAAVWGGAVLAKDGRDVVGATLWLPPGRYPLTWSRKLRMTSAMLRMVSAGPARAASFALLGARMARGNWTEPTWYLRAMGVHPDARRRGVGSLLLAPVLARADEEGAWCRLDISDPAGVHFLQRYGFMLCGTEVTVRGRGGAESASYLAMARPPG